jgi:hypothetical protein
MYKLFSSTLYVLGLMLGGLAGNALGHLHPSMVMFVQRDPMEYVDGSALYAYVRSGPTRSLDPSGMNRVSNVTDPGVPVWVLKDWQWIQLPPGASLEGGDFDMMCPPSNLSILAGPPVNDFLCLKITDCYMASAHNSTGTLKLIPDWGGPTTGWGNDWIRRCCCTDSWCASLGQSQTATDPVLKTAPSWPPDYVFPTPPIGTRITLPMEPPQ